MDPNGFDEMRAAIANATSAVEAAWNEESAAAQKLRDAQTATSMATHELALRQHERFRAEKALIELRKRLDDQIAANETTRGAGSRTKRSSRVWLIAPLIVLFASGFAGWQWTALNVRVCSTSMTDGVARDLLDNYHQFPYRYTLAAAGDDRPCDVRFNTAKSGDAGSIIARDGLVAIVNHHNRVHKLTASQLRDIFTGRIKNWSKVGGSKAAIVAVIPPDGTDEATEAKAFLKKSPASSVSRKSTSEIVKYVTSSSGKNAIGFVPFSAALAAKVVPIAGDPWPTAISIAHERYPLWIGLVAASDYRHPSAGAAGLIAFARSHDAHLLMARADLVTKGTSAP
ncbi:MAG: substrate-binding domain-containing protein [Vulcanimicrobiaceae bacterium]